MNSKKVKRPFRFEMKIVGSLVVILAIFITIRIISLQHMPAGYPATPEEVVQQFYGGYFVYLNEATIHKTTSNTDPTLQYVNQHEQYLSNDIVKNISNINLSCFSNIPQKISTRVMSEQRTTAEISLVEYFESGQASMTVETQLIHKKWLIQKIICSTPQ